jgi:ABC-type multidrug transport system ATPase subunit
MFKVENLQWTDDKKRISLQGIDFELAAGEVIGIWGGRGGGKSALLRLFLGLWAPHGGQIFFQGSPLTPRHRAKIAYLPQYWKGDPHQSVLEFLTFHTELYGKTVSEKHLNEILELFDLKNQKALPLARLEERKQVWLGMARLLLLDPELLLLDEPFNRLEALKKKEFESILQEMLQMKKGVIVTSSSLQDLEGWCSRIFLLAEGRFQDPMTTNYVKQYAKKSYFRLQVKASKRLEVAQYLKNSPEIQRWYQVGSEWLIVLKDSLLEREREREQERENRLRADLASGVQSFKEWKRSPEVILSELRQVPFFTFTLESPQVSQILPLLKKEKMVEQVLQEGSKLQGILRGYEGPLAFKESLSFLGIQDFRLNWEPINVATL